MALTTEWHPIRMGGTKTRSRALVVVSSDRVELRPVTSTYVLIGGCLAVGVWFGRQYVARVMRGMWPDMGLLVVILFVSVGCVLLYKAVQPIVFDKGRGRFWKGRKAGVALQEAEVPGHAVALAQIHALQLLPVGPHVAELNLVLADGSRINVVNQGPHEDMRTDAAALARFLDRPLWDATREHPLAG